MTGGVFTHEEDRCTFETLARGIEQLLLGMPAANPDDEARLQRGLALLDDLYASFQRQLGAAATGRQPASEGTARREGDRK